VGGDQCRTTLPNRKISVFKFGNDSEVVSRHPLKYSGHYIVEKLFILPTENIRYFVILRINSNCFLEGSLLMKAKFIVFVGKELPTYPPTYLPTHSPTYPPTYGCTVVCWTLAAFSVS
jgi:hypothetical protein